MENTNKKSILGNEKGLTLMELLAVIVILGIITAIAIPSIGGLIDKTKKETHRSNAQMIIDAARMKVTTDGGGTQDIYMAQLVAEGYLEKLPEDPENKNKPYIGTWTAPSTGTGSYVKATKASGKFTYTIYLIGERDDAGTDISYFDGDEESTIPTTAIN